MQVERLNFICTPQYTSDTRFLEMCFTSQSYFSLIKGSGTQSDPKFGRRGVVLLIPKPGKKGPGMPFRIASESFRNCVPVDSVTKILLINVFQIFLQDLRYAEILREKQAF
jgi:hypothetical protein